MSENEAIENLSVLLANILTIKRKIQTMKPNVLLVFHPASIRRTETRLDDRYLEFPELDQAIGAGLKVSGDINSRLMVAASLSILNGARSFVRTMISEFYQDIASLNSQLNFCASLIVALLVLVVSMVGVFFPIIVTTICI